MAQPPQPPQPSFGSRILQTLIPSWVPDITLFRQTDGEAIVSKMNTLLAVTTFVAALVFGMGVNPPAEYCKCFKEKHNVCNCTIAIYVWEFIMSEALVTCLLVIKFMVGQYPVRQFIYFLLLCLLIGYWCILTTFIPMVLWVIMLCLCCIPPIFALSLRRSIDQAVERNGGVVGGGIEAGAGHNVAIEAGAGGGVEEGAGQNVVVEAGAGGGVGASAGEPAEPAGDEAVGVGELAGVLAGDEAALELAGVLMAKSTIDPCDDLEVELIDSEEELIQKYEELVKVPYNIKKQSVHLSNKVIMLQQENSDFSIRTAEEVSFAANGITGTGMKAFDGVLQSNIMLKTLNLSGNPIGDEGVKCLCDILVNNNGIQKLQLNSTDLGDEGAENIADALKQNRTITTIDLGGNNIHAKGVTAIAEALKDNSVITFLELGYNPMGPDGVKALSEVLKFHGNIETLKLGWCQIGAKGAEFIADMLKYNTTIRVLDLRANGLRNEGASCLARSLKVVNEALSSLDLGFNEIRDDGAFAIAQALKANEDVTVTSLNLASNFLTKFGQSALTDARDHVYEMSEKEINIFF